MSGEAPSSSASISLAEQAFLAAWPHYATTRSLDALRAREYGRLDRLGHVYLDYTGGGLYADSQVRSHCELLLGNVFGNPHSSNPTSLASTRLVEEARSAVLDFFGASDDEYVAVFTANASGALKLVGESYPFGTGGRFLLTFDNHNSVNGIREFARARGATVNYAPVLPPDLRIDEARLAAFLTVSSAAENNARGAQPAELAARGPHRLFAYPAQSNFSGVQHSLEWVARAHEAGWDVLLDAAAFVPTSRLDLSRVKPDFVSVSFYKIFGHPTGIGCLLARRPALGKLRRPWFAGGTISLASVQADRHWLHPGAEGFEDGTLDYLSLPAITIGLDHIRSIGYEAIGIRVRSLTGWLLGELASLRHHNGNPVVRIYGPVGTDSRGGTVTCNFYAPDGRFIDHRVVELRANEARISLRTGCFCNPGGGELALGISADELTACFVSAPDRMTMDQFRSCIDDKSTGAVRISVGVASNFADVHRFMDFARGFVDRQPARS